MDVYLTEIKDSIRCANHTSSQFQCDDHTDLIFEQLAKECGFYLKLRNGLWTHLKDKNYSIQFDPETRKVWAEYKYKSDSRVIDTPSIFEFINEVLSFVRNFYMNRKN